MKRILSTTLIITILLSMLTFFSIPAFAKTYSAPAVQTSSGALIDIQVYSISSGQVI